MDAPTVTLLEQLYADLRHDLHRVPNDRRDAQLVALRRTIDAVKGAAQSGLLEARLTRSDAALALALDWAEGRRSYTNEFMKVEVGPDQRQQTLLLVAQADAAEAAKWAQVAVALSQLETRVVTPLHQTWTIATPQRQGGCTCVLTDPKHPDNAKCAVHGDTPQDES